MSCAGRTRRAAPKRGARTLVADDEAIGNHSLDEVGCPGPGGLKLGSWPDGVHVFCLMGLGDGLDFPGPLPGVPWEDFGLPSVPCILPTPAGPPCVRLAGAWSDVYFNPAGFDVYKDHTFSGAPTTVCGSTIYKGYAIPMFEPGSNLDEIDAYLLCRQNPVLDASLASAWESGALNFHADGTSPSSTWIEATSTWRMYINNLTLIDAETGLGGTPASNPGFTETRVRLPGYDDWVASGRFDSDYIAFVDSCDGGESYPIFAPALTADAPYGCPIGWVADWTNAGWRVTSIPSKTSEDPDGDGIYCVYREPMVFDFSEELCLYVMVCLECRSTLPSAGEDASDGGCVNEDTDMCSGRAFNRIVLFVSDTPDFSEGRVFPRPGYVDEALVLLQPDEGPYVPDSGNCQTEDYGVPHALLTPDRETLLLYAPWGTDTPGRLQARLARTYQTAEGYPVDGRALWQTGITNGISGFAIPVVALGDFLRDFAGPGGVLDEVERLFTTDAGRRDGLLAMVDSSYVGEVLIWDGVPSLDREAEFGQPAPEGATVTDPQWMFDASGELWVYFDLPPEGYTLHAQLRRASLLEEIAFLPRSFVWKLIYGVDYTEAFAANGHYTTFVVEGTVYDDPPTCDFNLDMRELFYHDEDGALTTSYSGWSPDAHGRMLGDPDALELDDGRVRVLYSGGETSTLAEGLHVAILS